MTDTQNTDDGYAVRQASQAALDAMTPQQVLAARAEGTLDRLIGVPPKHGAAETAARVADGISQLSAADLEEMTVAQIIAAKSAGRFADLLGQPRPVHTHPTHF